MNAPTVVELLETRTRDGQLEGLVRLSDGSQEWRAPSSVEVTVTNDRTGEDAQVSNVKLGGPSCE